VSCSGGSVTSLDRFATQPSMLDARRITQESLRLSIGCALGLLWIVGEYLPWQRTVYSSPLTTFKFNGSGTNHFAQSWCTLSGELEVELVPQGTLAERLRAGGAGIPAFYTPAGVGTQIANGGLPLRYGDNGAIALASPAKEVREFDGKAFVLEHAIRTDFALVHARYGDRYGNLIYEKSAQNFNPLCAAAGRITIAEVEELVEPGDLDPMHVHTPGIFVQRVVHVPNVEKRIEKRTVAQ
jgi:3-oxoacid CoA-transferase A subunit